MAYKRYKGFRGAEQIPNIDSIRFVRERLGVLLPFGPFAYRSVPRDAPSLINEEDYY
jgi:hypothetical protein